MLAMLLSLAVGRVADDALIDDLDGPSLQTTVVGPFGLAFAADVAATHKLSCASVRGRPFVTGLHVQQLHAPINGRDAYEFRIQCGPAATPWSQLGPKMLMWATAQRATASCPRPHSARGLVVTRGRGGGWSKADLYGFSLMCGSSDTELVEAHGLTAVDGVEESRGRACPAGAFISGLEIARGYEASGAYDLYEFSLSCSEVLENYKPPPPPPEGMTTRAFNAGSARGGSGGGGGGGGGGVRNHRKPIITTFSCAGPSLIGESAAKPLRRLPVASTSR